MVHVVVRLHCISSTSINQHIWQIALQLNDTILARKLCRNNTENHEKFSFENSNSSRNIIKATAPSIDNIRSILDPAWLTIQSRMQSIKTLVHICRLLQPHQIKKSSKTVAYMVPIVLQSPPIGDSFLSNQQKVKGS